MKIMDNKSNYIKGKALQKALTVNTELTIKSYQLAVTSTLGVKNFTNHVSWNVFRKPYRKTKVRVKSAAKTTGDFTAFFIGEVMEIGGNLFDF